MSDPKCPTCKGLGYVILRRDMWCPEMVVCHCVVEPHLPQLPEVRRG